MNFSRSISEVYKPLYNLSVQFNFKLNGDRWIISVLGNDLLFTMIHNWSVMPGEIIVNESRYTSLSRYAQITARYKFGKAVKTRSRKLERDRPQLSSG